MPERLRLSRQAGWRKPAGAIVVSRPTMFGNPFPVLIYGRDESVELHRRWLLRERITFNPAAVWNYGFPSLDDRWLAVMAGIRRLRGHDLLCWCDPGPCHADNLLRLANAEREP